MASITCLLVVGIPRSGTSCVAGVLHHLGVYMGEKLIRPSKWNPKGLFHDLEFDAAMVEAGHGDDGPLREMVARRESLGMPWGVNVRRTHRFLSYFPSPKVLWTRRPLGASESSWRAMQDSNDHLFVIQRMEERNTEAIQAFAGPVLPVEFNDLIEHRAREVQRIADFAGLPVTPEAVEFVDPTLRHH